MQSSDDVPVPQDEMSSPVERSRYRLVVAYEGTDFHGWQKQLVPEGPPLRTVAGTIEAVMLRVLRQPIDLVGASRTDTGVHAEGQVAHFDAKLSFPVDRLALALNSRLPPDIEIREAVAVEPGFHAIRGVVAKQYRYRILNRHRRPLHQRRVVWHCWTSLDPGAMRDAAARIVGTHDFEGFAAAGHGRRSTVRTVHECRVETDPARSGIDIVVVGDGFLYNMVRIIAGTLVEVGRGRFQPEVIDVVLASADRRQAGPTLPPQGLWLEWIKYAAAS